MRKSMKQSIVPFMLVLFAWSLYDANAGAQYGDGLQKEMCYAVASVATPLQENSQGVLCDKEGNIRSWSCMDDTVRGVKAEFFNMCKDQKEMALGVYEKDGKFYVGRAAYGGKESVPFDMSREDSGFGGRLVGVIHNHPYVLDLEESILKSREFINIKNAWPSVNDAKMARKFKIDAFILDCRGDADVILVVEGGNDCAVKRLAGESGGHRTEQGRSDKYPACNIGEGNSYWDPTKIRHLDKLIENEIMDEKFKGIAEKRTKDLFKGPETKQSPNQPKPHKDSVKEQKPVVAETQSHGEAVGVRGWCECGDNHGKLYEAGVLIRHLIITGMLNELGFVKRNEKAKQIDRDAADKMLLDARYVYILCAKCGKCRKPSRNPDTVEWDRIDWKDEWVIMDCILEFQLQDAKGLSTAQTVRAKLAPQKEFLSKFPNGGVVFPGACTCKVPDPIHVGFLESGYSPYVCLLCGHERLPDEAGSMPNGPTALKEMGLGEKAKQEERRILEWFASIIQSTRD